MNIYKERTLDFNPRLIPGYFILDPLLDIPNITIEVEKLISSGLINATKKSGLLKATTCK